jgi:Divergent InlB B-repeat domain/Viral BACON domain
VTAVTQVEQGSSVALSADGNTAIVGGPIDSGNTGAAWVWSRSNGVWTQRGNKLVGTGGVANVGQGSSVALSADGNTAIVGGPFDSGNTGAAWVFSTAPLLQVTPATTMDAAGNPGGPFAPSSFQYQLSATAGTINYSISGFPNWLTPSSTSGTASTGTTVTFTVNANANSLGVGIYGPTTITFTNSDSGQGTQTRTAALIVNPPALQVTPATNIVASGTQGGPFSPSSFSYTLSATYGSVNYSITNVPNWLTPSSTSGTASTGTTVTFTVNANANSLAANTYIAAITFTNSDTGQGTQSRTATLTVNPPTPVLQVTPTTSIVASGTQGGPFTPSSFSYTVRASSGSVNFSISGVPSWLTPSATSGAASTAGTPISFTVNASANSLAAGTYGPTTITFTNSDTGQGTQTRTATLTVNPLPLLQVTPASNMVASGTQGGPFSPSSFSDTLSATSGSVNYSISGVPNWLTPSTTSGAASPSGTAVTFTVNANAKSLAAGTYGPTTITFTNSDTGQGTQTRTATLTVNPPALMVAPTTGITAAGTHGGPFSPSSFRYMLSATFGSVKYSITTPSWLTAFSGSGTVTTSAKTITFTVNSSARSLGPNTYIDNIDFYNTTNSQGNTTRVATLIVNPKRYNITVRASPSADGSVSGGGTFPEGTSDTVTAMPKSGHTFVHWTENGKVVSTSESYTFTVSGNVTLVADFR